MILVPKPWIDHDLCTGLAHDPNPVLVPDTDSVTTFDTPPNIDSDTDCAPEHGLNPDLDFIGGLNGLAKRRITGTPGG